MRAKDTDRHNEAVSELILAAVPLGNIGDASTRLKEVISTVDVVAAEDSRRFLRLVKDLEVECSAQILSFFEGNESSRLDDIDSALKSGKKVLLVSDAGMPTVSDPGFRAVRMAIEKGYSVTVIPGPSAVLAALALSGLPTDSFAFDGFPPRTGGARDQWCDDRAHETRTLIIFEAPHRVRETLDSLRRSFGGARQAAICREITKTYEETIRGSIDELCDWSTSKEMLGEFTIVISGYDPLQSQISDADIAMIVRRNEGSGITRKEAIAMTAKELKIPKRKVFDIMVNEK
ncbi:MAG: 16S rRNA (cytidine(1402)-2'-O)-methyltransferase [Actinomycetota bacterium]